MEYNHDSDVDIWPALKFWYGFTLDELLETPRAILAVFIDKLPVLQAEYEMMHTRTTTFPHMKDSAQRRHMRELVETINDGQQQQTHRPQSTQEQASLALAAGIGFEIVNPTEEEDAS